MLASVRELLDAISLGESSFLEYKEVRFSGRRVKEPTRDRVADSLAAFANAQGGVFVFGVEDNTHEILGIPVDCLDSVTEFVRHLCADSVDPPLESVLMNRLRLPTSVGDEVAVVRIDVPRSLFVHRSPSGYVHRVGDANRLMSTEFLGRTFQQRSQTRLIRFDEQPVANARMEDLSPKRIDQLRTPRSDSDWATFAAKLGMARVDENGTSRPTVAGILMASEDPGQWLPNAYVQAVAYRGNAIRAGSASSAYQLDAEDVTGPLHHQVVGACRFVARNMRTAATKDQGRVDLPQYDMTAVFEAIVNAVAHRDYSVHGSKIRLRMFDNRLEIYSPGAIPNSLTIESLPYRQSARNEAICSLLAKCPIPDESWLTTNRANFMEKRGEGVPIIIENSTNLSGQTPEYRLIDDAELILTIHGADP